MWLYFFILQMGVMLVRGVGVKVFWKGIKIRKHVRFCDDILIEVSVLVMRAKNEKMLKKRNMEPLLWVYKGLVGF